MKTDLTREGGPVQRLNKVGIHLVGSNDNSGHGFLVLRRRRG